MVIVMKEGATEDQIERVIGRLTERGFDIHRSSGVTRTILGAIGEKRGIDPMEFALMSGVAEALTITEPYKLANRTFRPEGTVVEVAGVAIGSPRLAVMAGPCSVEDRDGLFEVARRVKAAGASFLRGGVFKPRSSPYSFQGLGRDGLEVLGAARREFGLGIVSEIMDPRQLDLMHDAVDILQVGARNMQNYDLLRELGRTDRPVLLKRGLSSTFEEWLLSAEYVMSGGNRNVVLCERGIRTFETYTRNTFDVSAIPAIKNLSHLPIVADPSHGVGRRDMVAAMARAAVAAGADGLLIEVHGDPDRALSDGPQSLLPDQFDQLMIQLRSIVAAVGREL